ncbi:LysE family translocator [Arthrobacter sp. H41]|uniref:LysE family translocator n=1 Tax=Arthrobacter sp. H41 TaxID=1312978 RepID=UPI00047C8B89|nr:LysE family translocator [Arthrobacter sp. H41]
MTVADALLSFALIAGLLTIVPGLDTALVLRSAITLGRGQAYAVALGVNTGAMVWGIAAAVGASALLAASTTAFTVLKIAGATYMVWLGASLLWATFQRSKASAIENAGLPAGSSLTRSWMKGAATNLLNPKVGVFYIAVIPQFIPDGAPPLWMGVALAGVHNLLGLIWFTLIIFGTHIARQWLRTPRITRATDRITGVALVGFGTTLALDAR